MKILKTTALMAIALIALLCGCEFKVDTSVQAKKTQCENIGDKQNVAEQ